ncbi:MAG: C2 family cysteine protease [Planctomycetaceae bacterium]
MTSNLRRFQAKSSRQGITCESLESRLLNSSTSVALKFTGSAAPVSDRNPVAGSISTSSVNSPANVRSSYEVTTNSVRVTIVSNDKSLSFLWETVETSSGKSVSFAKNNSSAAKDNTLKFTEAGLYVVRVSVIQAKQVVSTSTLSFQVNSVLSGLAITDGNGTPASSSKPVVTSGNSVQFSAYALDQFGIRLTTQPSVTWTTKTLPRGVTASTAQNGNNLQVGVNASGDYVFRATSGNLTSDVAVKVSQVLTTLSLQDESGAAITPDTPLSVTSTSARISLQGRDQFGNLMTTLPALTWTTLSAPETGTVKATMKGLLATLNFNRTGAFSVQAKSGSVIATATFDVKPALSSYQYLTPESKPVAGGKAIPVSGTSFSFRYVPLDQFGKPLADAPEVQWSASTTPLGATVTFTHDNGLITATFDRTGSYTLRLQSNSVRTDLSLNVTAVLTSLALGIPGGSSENSSEPISVVTATQQLQVIGLDQFGRTMSALPKLQWTATSAPDGGTISVRVTSTTAQVGFNKAGSWTVSVSSGAVSASKSFDVTPTATKVSLRNASGAAIAGTTPLVVSGKSVSLNAVIVDQFGTALTIQPEVSWRISKSPTGGNATVTTDGNSGSITFDKTGDWAVAIQSGTVTTELKLSVVATLTSMTFSNPDGTPLPADKPLKVTTALQTLKLTAVDQFGNALTVLPKVTWTTTAKPDGGVATGKLSSGIATVSFNKAGQYTVNATSGTVSAAASFDVVQTLRAIAVSGADGRTLNPASVISVTSATAVLTAVPVDQFGVLMPGAPDAQWERTSAPVGATTDIRANGTSLRVTFDRAGTYSIRGSVGDVSVNLKFEVVQALATIEVTPNLLKLNYGAKQVFKATALDQFGVALTVQPSFRWTATGGTITTTGEYKAGNVAGTFTVTATGGQKNGVASVEVASPVLPSGLQDPTIAAAVSNAYGDGLLNRTEMISILRLAGDDGTVSSTELSDYQYLVSPGAGFVILDYVRNLASDVVNSNSANAKFQGQTLGTLTGGSAATQLNRLIDKWFFGADVPQVTTNGLTWTTATGTLFPATPSRSDTKQGMLGDCYFISALAAIADRNPNAVRNMFIDNGDGTYTVRFYTGQYGNFNNNGTITSGFANGTGTADYVTVNRSLPVSSNGSLVYSGYGLSATSTSTVLWIALAEKAYAQWNETGNEGRDGTNRYAAIEGGWMADVNCQVLGYNSTNFPFYSASKSTLVTALTSQRAVTLGTQSSPTSGLVGSHAYVVTGYDSASDTFRLHNPWGTSHPGALTWAQLQANCSWFVVTDTSGSQSFTSPGSVGSSSSPRTKSVVIEHQSSSQADAASVPDATHSDEAHTSIAVTENTASVSDNEHTGTGSQAGFTGTVSGTSGTQNRATEFLVLSQSELDLLISELAGELLLPLKAV